MLLNIDIVFMLLNIANIYVTKYRYIMYVTKFRYVAKHRYDYVTKINLTSIIKKLQTCRYLQ